MKQRNSLKLMTIIMTLVAAGCSVEAGKIPVASAVLTPEGQEQARSDIRASLAEVQSTAQVMGTVQSVVLRGLNERNVDAGETSDAVTNLSLLAPSDADTLMIDSEHPDQVEYRLNNDATVSLRTKSNGKLDIVLKGTLEKKGEHYTLREARLEVIQDPEKTHQVFQILFEEKVEQNGETMTSWKIDFRQLNSIYTFLVDDGNPALSAVNGVIAILLSDKQTTITAQDFSIKHTNVLVKFDNVDVDLHKNQPKSEKILVAGHVEKSGHSIGEFSLSHEAASTATDLKVDFRL